MNQQKGVKNSKTNKILKTDDKLGYASVISEIILLGSNAAKVEKGCSADRNRIATREGASV